MNSRRYDNKISAQENVKGGGRGAVEDGVQPANDNVVDVRKLYFL